MNSFEFQIAAARAIEDFAKHHNTSCFVYIRDGIVFCCPTREAITKSPTILIFSRLQQKIGLTSAGWTIVGNALFNQYTKELACQAHQKH